MACRWGCQMGLEEPIENWNGFRVSPWQLLKEPTLFHQNILSIIEESNRNGTQSWQLLIFGEMFSDASIRPVDSPSLSRELLIDCPVFIITPVTLIESKRIVLVSLFAAIINHNENFPSDLYLVCWTQMTIFAVAAYPYRFLPQEMIFPCCLFGLNVIASGILLQVQAAGISDCSFKAQRTLIWSFQLPFRGSDHPPAPRIKWECGMPFIIPSHFWSIANHLIQLRAICIMSWWMIQVYNNAVHTREVETPPPGTGGTDDQQMGHHVYIAWYTTSPKYPPGPGTQRPTACTKASQRVDQIIDNAPSTQRSIRHLNYAPPLCRGTLSLNTPR